MRYEQHRAFSEKSFYHYTDKPDGKFRPGVLVRVVEGWDKNISYGTVGMYLGKARGKQRYGLNFLVLIGDEKISFSGFEIELL